MYKRFLGTVLICLMIAGVMGCSDFRVVQLDRYPLDTMEGVITRSGVTIDKEISSDGNGSLRIFTRKPTIVRLFEIDEINIQNARLIYQARMRTNLKGSAYLEMWCHFPGKGEYFSRDIQTPMTGISDWSVEEALFFLKKGENPDRVTLNLVINGEGTVWIDDIRLFKSPLK